MEKNELLKSSIMPELTIYNTLSPVEKTELQTIAEEIHFLNKKTAEITFKIGEGLARARDIFRHKDGGFQEWLKSEFDESRTKAYKYIKFYEKSIDENSSVPLLGHLKNLEVSQKTLFSLSETITPDEVVKEVITKIKAGETVNTTIIKEMTLKQNEKDIETIRKAINLRTCKMIIESGESFIDVFNRYGENVLLQWGAGAIGMNEELISSIMNAAISFKNAPDHILENLTVNEFYLKTDAQKYHFTNKFKVTKPEETNTFDFNNFSLNEKDKMFLNFEAGGCKCIGMLCIADTGKYYMKAKKIMKNDFNSWIKKTFQRNSSFIIFINQVLNSDFDFLKEDFQQADAPTTP